MTDHLHVARALDEISLLLDLSGENGFKVRAYERGARVVLELGESLSGLIEAGTLTKVEGIGDKLADQILQITNSGTSTLLDSLRSKTPPGAAELARIPGVTIKRIRALHDALGISSVEQLRDACIAKRVRGLPGFGAKTEERLLEAIERAAAPKTPTRLLLVDALALAERIAAALRALTGGAVLLAGALRRCEETVAQLDLVIETEDAEAIWSHVQRMPWVIAVDREKACARLSQGVPLVLHLASHERVAYALLTATGPQTHVATLQARARGRGLELDAVPARAESPEDAFYSALEIPYVPAELRGTRDDFDPRGYDDLIRATDITGMVHCHTTYSDGKHSIEEMALAAEALGMQYITITDHSPTASYAGGVTLERLKEQWDEIARVQERVRIRILRGTESDILADGALDYPDDVLERFDVVIASIHARHKLDRVHMTARLTRAMALPIFKIWGHALGRLLLSRDPIDCDVPAVLDTLMRAPGAIELNADPHRLDLPPEWISHARERRIPFVVSVDAHSTQGLGVLPLGVQVARRGGLRRSEVLNTLSADEFAARVRPA